MKTDKWRNEKTTTKNKGIKKNEWTFSKKSLLHIYLKSLISWQKAENYLSIADLRIDIPASQPYPAIWLLYQIIFRLYHIFIE